MIPLFVLLLSVIFLREVPTYKQLMGKVITICGVILFFYGVVPGVSEVHGLVLTVLSGVGWATYMIITRYFLRGDGVNFYILTTYSISFGSLMLLATAILNRQHHCSIN